MVVEGPIWERYDQAARGLPVEETDDFEWMLESPGEFELRVLVRHFQARDELLDRIGRFEHDPVPAYSDADVEQLVRSHVGTLQRGAKALDPAEYPWSTADLKVRRVSADHVPASADATRGLYSRVADRALGDLDAVTGGFALYRALEGRVRSLGLYYLLGPLISTESDFAATLALQKAGITVWIEGAHANVAMPIHETRWIEAAGWKPELDWPTNDDIAQHQEDAKTVRARSVLAQDPTTPAELLQELASDPSESVRFQLTRNPSAPAETIAMLSNDPSAPSWSDSSSVTMQRQRYSTEPSTTSSHACAPNSRSGATCSQGCMSN